MSTFKELGDKFLARFKRAHASRASYLSALAGALYGLPPELVANTLASYAHRFIEGATRGLSEQQVAAGLPSPRQVAAQCRAELRGSAFHANKSLPNLWRLLISLLGLCILNLFLSVPAIVFGTLLFAFYCTALALYACGIAITAGAIADVNEIVLSPHSPLAIWHNTEPGTEHDAGPARIHLAATGITLHSSPLHSTASGDGSSGDGAIDNGSSNDSSIHDVGGQQKAHEERGISLAGVADDFSRGQQSAVGIGLIAGAILMLLAALVVSKYAAIGLKRYVLMNYSLLRNA